MSMVDQLRNEIDLAQQAMTGIESAIKDAASFDELRPTLDAFLKHAILARLFSLYLGEASLDPAALELRDLFRSAANDRMGTMEPRYGMGVFRVADERFDFEAISDALADLKEMLDREGDTIKQELDQ